MFCEMLDYCDKLGVVVTLQSWNATHAGLGRELRHMPDEPELLVASKGIDASYR